VSASPGPGLGLVGALAADWTKTRTLASTGWLLLAAVLLTGGLVPCLRDV
jgi:hypothetical protein